MDSILDPVSFLIYISDLSDGSAVIPKLFMDDTSLFSFIQNINSAANDLNTYIIKVRYWVFVLGNEF